MEKLNKEEFIKTIIEYAYNDYEEKYSYATAKNIVDTTFKVILESLKEKVSVPVSGFGTFDFRISEARTARNPQTGETVEVPKKLMPHFSFAKSVKDDFKENGKV